MNTRTDADDPASSTDAPTPPAAFSVPPDADVHACEYCGAPFADAELLALHWGVDHAGELSPEQRERYEAAFEDEQEDVRLFRLKALAVLVVLYFGLLMTYSVFT